MATEIEWRKDWKPSELVVRSRWWTQVDGLLLDATADRYRAKIARLKAVRDGKEVGASGGALE